jgi:hypothetical protein
MTAEPSVANGRRAAWSRFLTRLTAIAWPFLTYWWIATARPSPPGDRPSATCGLLPFGYLLPVLAVIGTIALACAANMTGTPRRRTLILAAICGVAWIAIAVAVRWVVPDNACGSIV